MILCVEGQDPAWDGAFYADRWHAIRLEVDSRFCACLVQATLADSELVDLFLTTCKDKNLVCANLHTRGHHQSWQPALGVKGQDLPALGGLLRVQHLDWIVIVSIRERVASEDKAVALLKTAGAMRVSAYI